MFEMAAKWMIISVPGGSKSGNTGVLKILVAHFAAHTHIHTYIQRARCYNDTFTIRGRNRHPLTVSAHPSGRLLSLSLSLN